MNKEQFKAKFLEQFNHPDSPARALLYDFNRPWSQDNGIYRNAYKIHVKEFDLLIDIQKHRIDDDVQYFNVKMLDVSEVEQVELHYAKDLHDLSFFKGYYKEDIRFENNFLIFRIGCYSLLLENYTYKVDDLFHMDIRYNCIRNEFEDNEALKGILNYINGVRPKPEDMVNPYVEVSTLSPDINKIANQMKTARINEAFIEHFKNAFNSSPLGHEKSVMVSILEYMTKNKFKIHPF